MTAPTRRRVLPVLPRLEERASAERSDRRRRRLRRVGLLALGLVPLCLLSWVLLSSPLLQVDRVEVVGVSRLDAQAVRDVAAVAAGTPLARVDTGAVRARVAGLAPVSRVRVVRAWPTTLRLVVTERVPVASVRRSDGSWALVDGTGAAFGPSADAVPGLPELQVPPEQTGGPAVQVLAELPASLRGLVVVARSPSASSVELELQGGRTVVWGAPGQAVRKAAVVEALLPRPGRTIDVTSPDIAVVR